MWPFANFRRWGDMSMTNETDGTKRSVSSLGELSRDVAPSRDLWPSIAAQIAAYAVAHGVAQASPDVGRHIEAGDSLPRHATNRSRLRPSGMQWAALAAVVSALALGVWLGRSVLPSTGAPPVTVAANRTQPATTPATAANEAPASTPQQVFAASLVTDPRYTMQRATMIRDLEAQLKTLPLESQQKVAASLATIRASMKDIQAALGRDPANALLQELLVNSYQDEMRVLTAVHEASGAGRGI